MECTICCETVKKQIQCVYCEFECCTTCCKRYILDVSDPQCMNCNKIWPREFLNENFPKIFITKDLKKHREEVLLDREKAMMPSTQPHVTEYIEKKKISETLKDLRYQRQKINEQWRTINRLIQEAEDQLHYGVRREPVETFQTVIKCPKDGCRGFLDSDWKCSICESNVCKHCNEILNDEEHVCDEDVKKTVALLRKDSKPCGTCGTVIYKIGGCDQMWCPDCKTAFSWRTGRVERGVIHNPHYYEFMRNNQNVERNLGDFPCGGLPDYHRIVALTSFNAQIGYIHRLTGHIQRVELPRFRVRIEETNQDDRIKYMVNEITEEQFKVKIQRKEKANDKKRDIYAILDMVQTVSSDYMRNLAQIYVELYKKYGQRTVRTIIQDGKLTKDEVISIKKIVDELEELRIYANTSLETVGEKYNNKALYILENWRDIK